MRDWVGGETTRFPVRDLASFLGLRPPGSRLAPSPTGVSSFPRQPSCFVVEYILINPVIDGLMHDSSTTYQIKETGLRKQLWIVK
jgi:hypothetical protein